LAITVLYTAVSDLGSDLVPLFKLRTFENIFTQVYKGPQPSNICPVLASLTPKCMRLAACEPAGGVYSAPQDPLAGFAKWIKQEKDREGEG